MKAQNTTNCENCNNCAWYCHSDGKCYGSMTGKSFVIPYGIKQDGCRFWTADGLTDEERTELYPETLMTMAEVVA